MSLTSFQWWLRRMREVFFVLFLEAVQWAFVLHEEFMGSGLRGFSTPKGVWGGSVWCCKGSAWNRTQTFRSGRCSYKNGTVCLNSFPVEEVQSADTELRWKKLVCTPGRWNNPRWHKTGSEIKSGLSQMLLWKNRREVHNAINLQLAVYQHELSDKVLFP